MRREAAQQALDVCVSRLIRQEIPMKEHFVRLEQVAGELNAWLLAIAIGLAVLDFTVLVAKCMPLLPTPPAAAEAAGSGHIAAQPIPSKTLESRG